jgi:thiol-disulfide isomerase/thioredoxin
MPDTLPPTPKSDFDLAIRIRNLLIVVVAIVLSTAIFLGLRTETGSASLGAMADAATPLEVAISNGKPTLMEFYADWCTSCQAMAADMNALKQEYGDRVNFVMLNVDNSKWLPEMLRHHVDGIPHFVFLNPTGEAIASTIGEQPRTIMAANLTALSTDSPLPYQQINGQFSKVENSSVPQRSDDPRSHGASSQG